MNKPSQGLAVVPGAKVSGKIADVRGLPEGEPAISPPRFPDLVTPQDFQKVADEVREVSGGIPIGFKLSAQHIEDDIDFALEASADYIILDGRGGATGAAPEIFKNNISVPTIPALARARLHLDSKGAKDITLIITGGLRTESDFAKAQDEGTRGALLVGLLDPLVGPELGEIRSRVVVVARGNARTTRRCKEHRHERQGRSHAAGSYQDSGSATSTILAPDPLHGYV